MASHPGRTPESGGAEAATLRAQITALRVRLAQLTGETASGESVEQISDAFLTMDAEWRFLYLNAEAEQLLGRSRRELVGQVAWEAFPEAKGSVFQKEYERAVKEQRTVVFEAPYDPIGRWLRITAYPSNGGLAVYFQDITDRRRLETTQRLRAELLERIATDSPLQEILDTAVDLVEGQNPGGRCSILLLSDDGRRLKHGSAPRLPEAYIRAIDGSEIGPQAGSCGTAAFEKRQVIVTDIATDLRWAAYKDLALPHGLRACWSQPIFARSGQVLGTFAIYHDTPKAPEPGDLELVQSCAGVVGLALERHRAERQLRLLETSIAELNDIVLITEAEPIGEPGPRILFVNEAFERRTGYTRAEALGRTPRMLQGPKTQRAELDRIRAALEKWEPVRAELINYTKSQEPFWLELTITPVADASGWYTHWVAIERDITERKRAEEVQAGIVQLQRELAAGSGGMQAAMDLMASRAMALLRADGAVLELAEGSEMVYQAAAGSLAPHLALRLRREGSLSGLAMARQEVLRCEDTETDPRADQAACRRVGARSLVAAPILAEGKALGVLKVVSARPGAFSTLDAGHVQVLAEALGAALQRSRLTEQIQASEAQYRLLFRDNPFPMWVYEPETLRFLAVNQAALRQYGHGEQAFLAMTLKDLLADPDRAQGLLERPSRGPNGPLPSRHRRSDGSELAVEVTSDDILFGGQRARLVLALDITQRERAEAEARRFSRAQRLLSACNEALIRAQDEATLLQEICRIGVDIGGYRLAWVGFAREDAGRTVQPLATAGAGTGYFEGVEISWDGSVPEGRGPSGRCVRNGEVILVPDVARDPDFEPWRDRAEAHGFRGVINLPLKADGRTFGVVGFFSAEPMQLGREEIALLQELADDLAFGILNLRREEERGRLQQTLTHVGESVSRSTGEAFFQDLAAGMARALGADAALVTRILPGEPPRGRVLAGVLDGAALEPFEYLIPGSPCERLVEHESFVVPEGAAERYPGAPFLAKAGAQAYVGQRLDDAQGRPVGQLIVLWRARLEDARLAQATLRIFGTRAATELDRLKADARIREQASLLDEAGEAILTMDLEGHIRYWNGGAERLYGWSAAEAVGQRKEDLLQEVPQVFQEAFRRVLREGTWSGQFNPRTKDGRLLTVEAHWSLVKDERGLPRAILAINTDITRRLELENQLRQSQRLEVIGQLTGGVAHDFNNLLTVILGNADLLAQGLADNPRLLRLADMTRAAAQSGAELTRRLLAFARRQALQPRVLEVNGFLAGLDGMLRRTLGEDIEIEYVRGAGLWPALVDPAQLESAILNLCVNARDAMQAGGRLTLETANVHVDRVYADQHPDVAPGQYVLVAVSDTGVGIPPEHLARVFEPFFTTKEVGKGTGLGLSMVYGFVKQSKGHVKVYSEPGLGTTVRLYLPRADHAADAPAPAAAPTAALRGTESILLVEDNDLVRQVAEQQLLALGYRVITAPNGPAALDILERDEPVDLLFTDVVMPGGMTGAQLAKAAQALRPGLKVLYTSGYTENSIVHHGRLDKGVHLLNKPYRQIDLARMVREVLDGPTGK
ncbi:MAG TPA: PAS domain S-box protein [Holophagaceae bacterium]|nr:PAS domain S-box protein [Holophagaceae bacterium]